MIFDVASFGLRIVCGRFPYRALRQVLDCVENWRAIDPQKGVWYYTGSTPLCRQELVNVCKVLRANSVLFRVKYMVLNELKRNREEWRLYQTLQTGIVPTFHPPETPTPTPHNHLRSDSQCERKCVSHHKNQLELDTLRTQLSKAKETSERLAVKCCLLEREVCLAFAQ